VKEREVQSLRGFACLLLVLYHVVGNNQGRGLQIDEGPLRILINGLSVVRMPLFALIAGAMHAGYPRWGHRLISDKFLRLIVPMLTVGTLFAIVQSITPETNSQVADWRLLHLLPVAHYWFLESLFLLFGVMALLQHASLLDTVPRFALVFAASTLAYLMHSGVAWLGISGMFYLMPYFLCGFALEHFKVCQPNARRMAPLMFVMAAIIMLVWANPEVEADRFGWAMLAIGLLSSAAFWLRPVQSARLARIGDFSYTIFLFHVFFTSASRIVLNQLGVHALAIHLVAGVASGLIGSMAIHAMVMRSTVLQALVWGKFKKKRTPERPSQPNGTPGYPQENS
jgi:surface polysaccharide O-acyltransferase-like enzyme